MKKILGISLCALFAVSAANAEITSRDYVDHVVGANTTRINTLNTAIAGMNQTQTQGDYVTFVKQEGGQVTASGASFATDVAIGGASAPTSAAVVAYVEGQVDELEVGNLADRVAANESAIGENATKIATNDSRIATNTGSINTLNNSMTALEERVELDEGKITANTNAIALMNAESTRGQYVRYVKQENGKVIAEGTDFDTSVSDTSNNAPTSKAVADHVATYVANNAVQTVESGTTNGTIKVDGQEVSVAGLGSAAYTDASTLATTANITALQGNIADVQDEIDEIEQEMVTTGNNLETQTNLLASIVNAAGYQNCANESGCTLVRDSDGFKWEAVTREVSAQ